MAIVKGVCCVVFMFVFMCCFVSLVVSVQQNGDFPNPSINTFDVFSLDGNSFDLHETFYHVHKRSADIPTKKAVAVQKKIIFKSIASNVDKALTKHLMGDKSIAAENSTTPSTTVVLDNSTSGTNFPDDKYNASVSSTISTLSTSLASTLSTLSTSSSSSLPVNDSMTTATTVVTSGIDSVSSAASTSATTKATSPLSTASTEVLPTKPSDVANATEDHHVYYNSSLITDEKKAMSYLVDFDKLPVDKVVVHRMLSYSHRRAATVTLSFDFPFYGSPIRNITIATGGFLYMGDYMHSWLAATQYVAPLMANFDTSLSNDSTVRYFDNGTAFVIEWNNVSLQERNIDEKFTFQAILLKNGDIIFVYDAIPLSVNEIADESHPVKVGLSDAYVINRMVYFIRRKTIYEYHRIDLKNRIEISNHTAIYFTALTTCMNFQDCESCMAANISLACIWCNAAKRCSDGYDRKRQDWLQQQCDVEKSKVDCSLKPSPNLEPFVQPITVSNEVKSSVRRGWELLKNRNTPPKTYTPFTPISSNDILQHPSASAHQSANIKPEQAAGFDNEISRSAQVDMRQGNYSIGGVVAVLLLVALALGTLAWVGYAYRNPHTSSGQLLIKYRPSQWHFRSGEARYTAASVHM